MSHPRRLDTSIALVAAAALCLTGCGCDGAPVDASGLDASPVDASPDAPSACEQACNACSILGCDLMCESAGRVACFTAATGCDEVRACLSGPPP